ncbi:MAG: M14 family metallopeptidase [Pseudomonadota bacterium]|nr:M14 family metallopeptidase [Pseudomonadota bacterium]
MRETYLQIRGAFLSAARDAAVPVISYEMPNHRGNSCNEVLATDVALLGETEATTVVVVTSGAHGVELPFGSRLQRAWLSTAQELCAEHNQVRFVFAHALNPFGAAYGLRTDQDNIDVTRNFVDFKEPRPLSVGYRAIADALAPVDLGAAFRAKSWAKMLHYALVTNSMGEFTQNLAGGQYEFPKGLYYGGDAPSWSRITWEKIIHDHVDDKYIQTLWHLDLHTGTGARGQLQVLINNDKDSSLYNSLNPVCEPARTGDRTATDGPKPTNLVRASTTGDIVDFWPRAGLSRPVNIVPVALEVGTSKLPGPFNGMDVLDSMIKRNALSQNFHDRHPSTEKIIETMRDTFDPQDRKWQASAFRQGQEFWDRLISQVAPK